MLVAAFAVQAWQYARRMRLYQALPSYLQRRVPKLLITDSQINNVCRDYYNNPNFGAKDSTISMFDFHNLLTEANKSSYIDRAMCSVASMLQK